MVSLLHRRELTVDPSGLRSLIAIAISLLLAACQAPVATVPAKAPVAVAAATPVQPPPERAPLARWSFRETQAGCLATLSNSQVSVTVTAGPLHALSISMAPKPYLGTTSTQASIAFRGRRGWRLAAHAAGGAVDASLSADPRGLDDLLALLGGGQLSARAAGTVLPDLTVPDSGVAGRDWYGCAARAINDEG